ncbi:hypothetical protein [Asaia bogorensis]|uniref:hypothetical protein n=1 Tax=Asaia bogorensis TaxID=91915 RepID=UPI00285FE5A6|nr:hypothetical protein [Asaia bogorensis]MDR6183181.1 hypothetical protein [Asaia bogorensis NBRC 16594]
MSRGGLAMSIGQPPAGLSDGSGVLEDDMSCGGVPPSGDQLSDEEKTEIRRFCGYAALGDVGSGESSWRFFQSAGTLEFRLNTLAPPERRRMRYFLATLLQMERAISRASDTLDTQVASVWTRNTRELSERVRLLDWWRRRVCGFLGVAPGPDMQDHALIAL